MGNVESLTNPRTALPNTYTNVDARELDFVSRFTRNWQALQEILGIMDPVRKTPGTKLVSYIASVTLEDGDVDPGCVIPYSKASVTEVEHADLKVEKYAKGTTIEEVAKYGAKIAVQKTDDAFLTELQDKVMDGFYDFLAGDQSAMTDTYGTFQMAVSMAIGKVRDKFKRMKKNAKNVVVFVNTLDVYKYLGTADITVQQDFGLEYVKNFMGASTMIITSEVEEGTVIAIPADNIVLYYIDPGDSDFAQLGLKYRVEGETNLIGFHAEGNYNTAVGESFALMGMKLWLEYADGVAINTIDENP